MLTAPIVIHVQRPYDSEEEYLERESNTISPRSMLLIDQPALPLETLIVFDVSLNNGHKPIRAEGKVMAYVPETGAEPGGLRVRFKRFGAATKAFIDRAAALSARPSLLPATPSSTRESELPSAPTAEAAPPARITLPSPSGAADGDDTQESSGVHRKPVLPVPAPANRDALLARLRSRRAS